MSCLWILNSVMTNKVFHLHIYLHLKVPCIPVLHNVLDMLLVNQQWIWSLQQPLLPVEHLVGHLLSGHRIWLEYRVLMKCHGEIVNLADSRMDCLRGCLATLSVLVVRIAILEYSEKAYKFIVCEFGGFQNVLRDALNSPVAQWPTV